MVAVTETGSVVNAPTDAVVNGREVLVEAGRRAANAGMVTVTSDEGSVETSDVETAVTTAEGMEAAMSAVMAAGMRRAVGPVVRTARALRRSAPDSARSG